MINLNFMFTNAKKQYFIKKADAVQKMIWDLEFKQEKTLMIREEVRSEFDALQAKMHAIDTQIKALPEDRKEWTDEQKQLDDQMVISQRDSEALMGQMKGLDVEISGSPKTNEFPEGYNGIVQQIDALRELKEMLRQYIKTL